MLSSPPPITVRAPCQPSYASGTFHRELTRASGSDRFLMKPWDRDRLFWTGSPKITNQLCPHTCTLKIPNSQDGPVFSPFPWMWDPTSFRVLPGSSSLFLRALSAQSSLALVWTSPLPPA